MRLLRPVVAVCSRTCQSLGARSWAPKQQRAHYTPANSVWKYYWEQVEVLKSKHKPAGAAPKKPKKPKKPRKVARRRTMPTLRRQDLEDKKAWYARVRAKNRLPRRMYLGWLVRAAILAGDRECWETVVHQHLEGYVRRIEGLDVKERKKKYTETMWSYAMYGYAVEGSMAEALVYYDKIVRAGGYPLSFACAMVLERLGRAEKPGRVPVLPQKERWPRTEVICGVQPVDPPRGAARKDRYLEPRSLSEYRRLVAVTGQAMLYGVLAHGGWPSSQLYTVLMRVLGQAGMTSEMAYLVDRVFAQVQGALPLKYRNDATYAPSGQTWVALLSGALESGRRDLAQQWFQVFRSSTMPRLRSEALERQGLQWRGLPRRARLYHLARAYYVIPQIERPGGDSGGEWFDRTEVKRQLELDEQRRADGLPLPFGGARRMLRLVTEVPELWSVDRADEISSGIRQAFQSPLVPEEAQASGYAELAQCWRVVLGAFCEHVRRRQADPGSTRAADRWALDTEPTPDDRIFGRLMFWYNEWQAACGKAGIDQAGIDPADAQIVAQAQRHLNGGTTDGPEQASSSGGGY
ncbi:hypothetical protein GGF46_003841 [Coemansia sp. RSA 552]|nr:hypothetical protein GGF46_003841 [Coemansia sp. RSA 552]